MQRQHCRKIAYEKIDKKHQKHAGKTQYIVAGRGLAQRRGGKYIGAYNGINAGCQGGQQQRNTVCRKKTFRVLEARVRGLMLKRMWIDRIVSRKRNIR
jgi:hypothetical protein